MLVAVTLEHVLGGAVIVVNVVIFVVTISKPTRTDKVGGTSRTTGWGFFVIGLALTAAASVGLSMFLTERRMAEETDAREAWERDARKAFAKSEHDTRRSRDEIVKLIATLPNREQVREALKGTTLGQSVERAQEQTACPPAGSFVRGEGQLRVFASDTQAEALAKKSALTTLLHEKGLTDWMKWIDVFSSNLGPDAVWVVVFNKVEPSRRDQMCDWLQCTGWKSGHLKCDLR